MHKPTQDNSRNHFDGKIVYYLYLKRFAGTLLPRACYAYPSPRALNAIYRRFCIPCQNLQSANAKPPLGTATLLQKCKQIRVHDVECAVGLALLNDAGNVDLAGALRDHLDVDALFSESAEETATDADHAA